MRYRTQATVLAAALVAAGFAAVSNAQADATCPKGTVMNVVAHEDDDILFQSPDLLKSFTEGKCVRTVFLTAGDAGMSKTGTVDDKSHWRKRERGAEAAYSKMTTTGSWTEKKIPVTADGRTLQVQSATSTENPKVSLVFLRLPDGGKTGEGFAKTGNQSLQKVAKDKGTAVAVDDSKISYDKALLQNVLKALMTTFTPDVVRMQDDTLGLPPTNDHSDHVAGAKMTKEAFNQYKSSVNTQATLVAYKGYVIVTDDQTYPPNVTGDVYTTKKSVFDAYAPFDMYLPKTPEDPKDKCGYSSDYCKYLRRQYTVKG